MSKINLYINSKHVNGKTLPKYEHNIVLPKSKQSTARKRKGFVKPDVSILSAYTRFIHQLSVELDLRIEMFNVAFTSYLNHASVLDMPYYMTKEVNRGNILIEIQTEADEPKEEAFFKRIISEYPGPADILSFM